MHMPRPSHRYEAEVWCRELAAAGRGLFDWQEEADAMLTRFPARRIRRVLALLRGIFGSGHACGNPGALPEGCSCLPGGCSGDCRVYLGPADRDYRLFAQLHGYRRGDTAWLRVRCLVQAPGRPLVPGSRHAGTTPGRFGNTDGVSPEFLPSAELAGWFRPDEGGS
jgi:hypothetical protein